MAPQLPIELRPQALLVATTYAPVVRGHWRMGTEDGGERRVRATMLSLRQTEELVQEGPMPAADSVEHRVCNLLGRSGPVARWTPFPADGTACHAHISQYNSFVETIVLATGGPVKMVSWKLVVCAIGILDRGGP